MKSKLTALIESAQKENIQLALTISKNPDKLVEEYHKVLLFLSSKGKWRRDEKREYWEYLENDTERIYSLLSRNEVILENCGLRKIPTEIFPLKNIEYLFLENNHIKDISNEILKFPKLTFIYLSNNPIAKDKTKIDSLQKLIPKCKIVL